MPFHLLTSNLLLTISIDLEVNTSVEDIYQYFLANSQSFQLLEYMFFNVRLYIYRTIEKIFTLVVPIYIDCRNITKVLSSQFQIEFSFLLHPRYVDVRSIFVIFAQYFSERYYFLDWPFPDLPEEDLTEFADFFYKITNYPMRFSIYRMYKLMI